MSSYRAQIPKKFAPLLLKRSRYKVGYGGRLGAKTWNFGRALLIHGTGETYFGGPIRVLCARETQRSIAESVHETLRSQIGLLGLDEFYRVKETYIEGKNGTVFLFAGIRQQNVVNLKSFEGADVCWVEEGQVVTKRSWEILIPTIRKQGSEIWVSFNPELQTDETYKRFILNTPEDCELIKVNYYDNPFLSETSRKEIDELREKDPDAYQHVYEGLCRQIVEGAVYKNELQACEKEGRICRVPYDPLKPVDTFWDLGYADNTCIWLGQSIGFEFRFIDFISGSQQGLQYYLRTLQEKGYVYGTDYLPHDARAHQLGTGRSIEEQIRASGRNVHVVPRLSVEDGIAAARAIFSKSYFDAERTADGIQALRHYRYEMDDKLLTLKKQPLHDWASHAADAFRTAAVAIKEPQRQQERALQVVNHYGESGWMA